MQEEQAVFYRAWVGAVLLCAGCVSTIQVNGLETSEKWWGVYSEELRTRAAFDMECPVDDLELTLLSVATGTNLPQQAGVTGCGERLVYVYVGGSGWVLNSQNGEAR